MSQETQPAREAVLRFARAWTAWEIQMASDKDSLRDPAMLAAHAGLIADHCTPKKRAYVDGLLTYAEPPTYADVVEASVVHEELADSGKAHIDVRCSQRFYRFVVHKKRDGWRVDNIKWKAAEEAAWANGSIGM